MDHFLSFISIFHVRLFVAVGPQTINGLGSDFDLPKSNSNMTRFCLKFKAKFKLTKLFFFPLSLLRTCTITNVINLRKTREKTKKNIM